MQPSFLGNSLGLNKGDGSAANNLKRSEGKLEAVFRKATRQGWFDGVSPLVLTVWIRILFMSPFSGSTPETAIRRCLGTINRNCGQSGKTGTQGAGDNGSIGSLT